MSTMTITIERTPRTLQFSGQSIQIEELSIRLPFSRKPADLGELSGSDQHKVYITETKELTTAEFDAFSRSLLVSRDWLRGKGGGSGDGYLCVEVTAPGRPYLYVNPEGGDYARYVARLG
ncbi:hypothetical protein OU995_22895 [Roseateles sp. SL47]|uniref:hypothetical protein n=1 Tax=Roseateles sp. SL47 TaxID=2995138 RepID=UPI00226E7E40|nr:hypothetical protein [Roseateles sp. SL47]WAC72376.1 hypothetical protein OU995_22895 [Roseateles sp. SL47]